MVVEGGEGEGIQQGVMICPTGWIAVEKNIPSALFLFFYPSPHLIFLLLGVAVINTGASVRLA